MFEHGCYERCPAGLVRCTEAAPVIAMKVLVEQHQVFPVRIFGVAIVRAVTGLSTRRIRLKDQDQSSFYFVSHLS